MANPTLEVFLNGTLAGALLRKDNGNLQFRYDDAYVEAKGAPLSLNLPLRSEAFPHRDCLAFFGNLLPEEDVRAQVALTTGISAGNDYSLLERFGGDVAGAVTAPARGGVRGEARARQPRDVSPAKLDELLTGLPAAPAGRRRGGRDPDVARRRPEQAAGRRGRRAASPCRTDPGSRPLTSSSPSPPASQAWWRTSSFACAWPRRSACRWPTSSAPRPSPGLALSGRQPL